MLVHVCVSRFAVTMTLARDVLSELRHKVSFRWMETFVHHTALGGSGIWKLEVQRLII